MVTSAYDMKTEGDVLTFWTSSFKAEKTSVLHEGVYTKEFSSMLLASAACIGVYMLLDYLNSRSPLLRYTLLIGVFIVSFLLAGKFVFKDTYLEAVFNRAEGIIHVTRSGLLMKRTEHIPFSEAESLGIGHKEFVPVNKDGIDFVQKISAQHGSAVPGLSEVEEFVTLVLRLRDGTERILYSTRLESGKTDGEPDIPLQELRAFLGSGTGNAG